MLNINIIEIIKVAAVDAFKALVPSNVVYGEVVSASPLRIKIDQKIILDSYFLVLTRNVTNYKVMTTTQGEHTHPGFIGDSGPHEHEVTIDNALKVGDKVAMIMAQGGQSYLVIDKVVDA